MFLFAINEHLAFSTNTQKESVAKSKLLSIVLLADFQYSHQPRLIRPRPAPRPPARTRTVKPGF